MKRILTCAALTSAGIAVAAGCPILAPAVAALGSEQIGGKIVDTIAGVAANILASDVQASLDGGGFDPQTNHDLHIAIGQAIAVAFDREAARHGWMSRGRRRCLKFAGIARTQWIETRNLAAFEPLRSEHAIRHLTAATGTDDSAPAVMDSWRDWLNVFGELRRLGNEATSPDQAVLERIAMDLHERFTVYLRNILKGDAQRGNNRAFNALHLDFMRLVITGQTKAAEQLADAKQLSKDVLEKLKSIEVQLAGNVRRFKSDLDESSLARLAAITHGIERAENAITEALKSLSRIEQGVESIQEKTDLILRLLRSGQVVSAGSAGAQDRTAAISASPVLETASEDAVRSLVQAAQAGNALASRAIDDYLRTRDVEQFKTYFDRFTDEADAIAVDRHRQRAALMYTIGDIERAVDSLKKVLALNSKDVDAIGLMGHVHQLRGELDQAASYFRLMIELAPNDKRTEADATADLAYLRLIHGDVAEAEVMLRQSLGIMEGIGDEEGIACHSMNLGVALKLRGDLDAAESCFRRALPVLVRLGRLDGAADCYGNLGTVHQFRGELDAAEAMYQESLKINEQLGRTAKVGSQLGNLGQVRRLRGDLDGAEALYTKSLAIAESTGSVEAMATECGNLGVVHRGRGDLAKAEQFYLRSLDLHQRLGKIDGVAGCQINLAILHHIRKDYESAERSYLSAAATFEKVGLMHNVAAALGNLGMLHQDRGNLDEAEAVLRKSLAISEQLGHRETIGNQYGNLASVMRLRGDLSVANAMYRRAIDVHRSIGRLDAMADQFSNVGLVLAEQGAFAESASAYAEAVKINRDLGRNVENADCSISLGSSLFQQGEVEAAEAAYREAIALSETLQRKDLLARAKLGLGFLQAAAGEFSAARQSWESTRAIAVELGAAPMVESVEAYLQQLAQAERT